MKFLHPSSSFILINSHLFFSHPPQTPPISSLFSSSVSSPLSFQGLLQRFPTSLVCEETRVHPHFRLSQSTIGLDVINAISGRMFSTRAVKWIRRVTCLSISFSVEWLHNSSSEKRQCIAAFSDCDASNYFGKMLFDLGAPINNRMFLQRDVGIDAFSLDEKMIENPRYLLKMEIEASTFITKSHS